MVSAWEKPPLASSAPTMYSRRERRFISRVIAAGTRRRDNIWHCPAVKVQFWSNAERGRDVQGGIGVPVCCCDPTRTQSTRSRLRGSRPSDVRSGTIKAHPHALHCRRTSAKSRADLHRECGITAVARRMRLMRLSANCILTAVRGKICLPLVSFRCNHPSL